MLAETTGVGPFHAGGGGGGGGWSAGGGNGAAATRQVFDGASRKVPGPHSAAWLTGGATTAIAAPKISGPSPAATRWIIVISSGLLEALRPAIVATPSASGPRRSALPNEARVLTGEVPENRGWAVGVVVLTACGVLATPAPANADRSTPPLLYGYYDVFVDFSKQTFNGVPTPMPARTFLVEFTARCEVGGCVVSMDNSDDLNRNPGAPKAFEYAWNNNRWETSGAYPYFCERMNPDSAVPSVRSDYLIPNPDGSFSGERTLTVEGAGCPGEGPGTDWLPITATPTDPPPAGR
jgi:hypothetical protein